MTAGDVGERARKVFMNDADAQLYSNTILLPFIQQAYGELQIELTANGLQVTKEVSTTLVVAAGVSPTITVDNINDLVIPLELFERAVGETFFIPMGKLTWEPEAERTETLRYWNWRENEIKMLGSTAIREIKVRYIKGLPAPINENSLILINSSLEFLAARASGLASQFVGGNVARADTCNIDAGRLLPKLVSIEVLANQGIGVRRKPFGYRRKVL